VARGLSLFGGASSEVRRCNHSLIFNCSLYTARCNARQDTLTIYDTAPTLSARHSITSLVVMSCCAKQGSTMP